MWLEPTAAHCSTTGRTRSNAPSIRPAANSTASSINPSAEPSNHPRIPRKRQNYWIAVRKWLPGAWNKPHDYSIFKGVGLYAISYVGIEVIDRSLLKGKFSSEDMLEYLKQMPSESLASG